MFLSKTFSSLACCKGLRFTTEVSVLELAIAFASAWFCTIPRRSNFRFLPELSHGRVGAGGGRAETGHIKPWKVRLGSVGSPGTAGSRGSLSQQGADNQVRADILVHGYSWVSRAFGSRIPTADSLLFYLVLGGQVAFSVASA